MKLLEYEAKQILKACGAPVADFMVVRTGESLTTQPTLPAVVKSQVPVGGRGKAGGVIVVNDTNEFFEALERVSLLEIKGHLPQALLIEPKLSVAAEHYLSLLINLETVSVQLMVHAQGGVEVETNTSGFFSVDITPETIPDIAGRVAAIYKEKEVAPLRNLLKNLYDCFVQNDATLLEINPLVLTNEGQYICADAKMELDDAAAFRHKEWHFEDKPAEVNFVTLDPEGEVATIANGAGLAMATVDAVAARGMKPANFLDVGGGANKDSVLKAFERIMEYKGVHAIVVNIFAGITRCDEVAKAIIAAQSEITGLPPLFIRLAGTNFEEAAHLLRQEGISTLATLEACLDSAKGAVE